MRMSDGFFSGQGTDAAPFAVWLWPSSAERGEFPLGVTTATWEAAALASRKINAWLEVEVDFEQGRADTLLDGD